MPKLDFGELAPRFRALSPINPRFVFDSVAGRPVFLVFLGSPGGKPAVNLVEEVNRLRDAFNPRDMVLFYVVSHPDDIARFKVKEALPAINYFMDYDRTIAALFGFTAVTREGRPQSPTAPVETGVVLLDRALRCLDSVPITGLRPVIAPMIETLRRLAQWQSAAPNINHAPVLVVERIFEPEFCRTLIEYYKKKGGEDSGFVSERGGVTVGKIDHTFKRRHDCIIEDIELLEAAMSRVYHRLGPMMRNAYQFNPTRIERHIVACYLAEEGGFFRAHRDNTTKGTAHRRFAVTINLNTEEYEGGDLRLPEFGRQAYRAPTGGAVVFSCSLLHEALPVTKGTRFAYLPFFYRDEDAKLREQNKQFLDKASGGFAEVTAKE